MRGLAVNPERLSIAVASVVVVLIAVSLFEFAAVEARANWQFKALSVNGGPDHLREHESLYTRLRTLAPRAIYVIPNNRIGDVRLNSTDHLSRLVAIGGAKAVYRISYNPRELSRSSRISAEYLVAEGRMRFGSRRSGHPWVRYHIYLAGDDVETLYLVLHSRTRFSFVDARLLDSDRLPGIAND